MAELKGGISVIGAGSWGTTLARLLAKKGRTVRLWVREPDVLSEIETKRENTVFLPGIRLPDKILATGSLEEALDNAGLIVSVVPSHGIREVFTAAAGFIPVGAVIVSASKGIEERTHLSSSAVINDTLSGGSDCVVVVLSGPTFAREVAAGLPAAVSAASVSAAAVALVQDVFSTPAFRVYTNADPVGVELGGALKNIIAIASGISDGLELGSNARAALITRGLAEIARLGKAMGASAETFAGLSGIGDLVLTATGPLSRNRTVGLRIGRGEGIDEIVASMKMVAEGVKTSRSVSELAREKGVQMPITDEVCRVLFESKAPKEAVMELMSRELKGE